jgi:hypothetical protein
MREGARVLGAAERGETSACAPGPGRSAGTKSLQKTVVLFSGRPQTDFFEEFT